MNKFFSKTQAAQYLKVSSRTLQRYMTQRKIRYFYRQTKRGKQVIFSERDLRNFKIEQSEASVVNRKQPLISQSDQRKQIALMQRIATALDRIVMANKLALTREEAAEISGYPLARIKDAIQRRELSATMTGRGVRISRVDLNNYIIQLTARGTA